MQLHKKIAHLHMQRQASTAVYSFPSVLNALKDFDDRKIASDTIIEILTEILVDFIYADPSMAYDIDVKVLKQEKIYDEVVVGETPESRTPYGWSEAESVTEEGVVGQSISALFSVNRMDVADVLATHLNRRLASKLSSKLTSSQLLQDFQGKELVNVLTLMLKANFKRIKFSQDEIEEFIHSYREFDLDYLEENGLDRGQNYVTEASLELKDVIWNAGNLTAKIEFYEIHSVSGN